MLRSLILFNLLFAVQTVLDIVYLWGNVALPADISYASYAHRGAYPLILTALIAAANKSPWPACTYLVATTLISVVATLLLRPQSGEDVVEGDGL